MKGFLALLCSSLFFAQLVGAKRELFELSSEKLDLIQCRLKEPDARLIETCQNVEIDLGVLIKSRVILWKGEEFTLTDQSKHGNEVTANYVNSNENATLIIRWTEEDGVINKMEASQGLDNLWYDEQSQLFWEFKTQSSDLISIVQNREVQDCRELNVGNHVYGCAQVEVNLAALASDFIGDFERQKRDSDEEVEISCDSNSDCSSLLIVKDLYNEDSKVQWKVKNEEDLIDFYAEFHYYNGTTAIIRKDEDGDKYLLTSLADNLSWLNSGGQEGHVEVVANLVEDELDIYWPNWGMLRLKNETQTRIYGGENVEERSLRYYEMESGEIAQISLNKSGSKVVSVEARAGTDIIYTDEFGQFHMKQIEPKELFFPIPSLIDETCEELIDCEVVVINEDALGYSRISIRNTTFSRTDSDTESELGCSPAGNGQLDCLAEHHHYSTYVEEPEGQSMSLEWSTKNHEGDEPEIAALEAQISATQWNLIYMAEGNKFIAGFRPEILFTPSDEPIVTEEECQSQGLSNCSRVKFNEEAINATYVIWPNLNQTFEMAPNTTSLIDQESYCEFVPGQRFPDCHEVSSFEAAYEAVNGTEAELQMQWQVQDGVLIAINTTLSTMDGEGLMLVKTEAEGDTLMGTTHLVA